MDRKIFTLRQLEPAILSAGIAVRYFERYRSTGVELHGHDIVEMNFILKGTADHHLEESTTRIKPGTLGIVHYGRTHGYRTGNEGIELFNIYVDPQHHPVPDIGPALRTQIPRFLPLHPELGHHQNRLLHLQFGSTRRMASILGLMAEESRDRTTGYAESLRAGYRMFLVECARLLAAENPRPGTPADPAAQAMEDLRRYIDASFTGPLTLTGLADRTGLAPTYLCRVFKKHTGRTLVRYITQRRIEAAMVQLTSTNDKVLSVAYECGFGDLAHFNRTFKNLAGISPSGYRKKMGGVTSSLSGTVGTVPDLS